MVSSSETHQQQQQQQQKPNRDKQLKYQKQERYLQQQLRQQLIRRKSLEQKQQQQQQQSTTASTAAASANNAPEKWASISINKSSKPLTNKTFYLDIKNHVLSGKLESKLKEFGGEIELFLVRSVTVVITDRESSGQSSSTSRSKWGCASAESGGPPSLRSIEVPTPTPTPPTPYHSVEGPLSNSTNQQGQPTQRTKSRVDAMLERALTQPQQCSVDPLYNARNWDIPIWSPHDLQVWLDKIEEALSRTNILSRDNRSSSRNEVRIRHLKSPFIKFESYYRDTRPVFVELDKWPTLNFDGDAGTCPFLYVDREKKDIHPVKKEIKENREKKPVNYTVPKGKEMTRRPRAPAVRGRKTENTGYCEICRIDYRSLTKHLQTDQHLSYVHDDKNFLTLDNLISTGASVEAFLRINRANDVSKEEECNLYSSRDHNLDNGALSTDEKSEKKSNLSNCNTDDVKAMQCNGVRKNLKLDSTTHNLRTRAKHESGHLLRSKGRPSNEEEKSDKSLDKYTIKKRAKGTIWIEENDSEDDKSVQNEKEQCDENPLFDKLCNSETKKSINNGENSLEKVSMNGEIDHNSADCKRKESSPNKMKIKDNTLKESLLEASPKAKKESVLEANLKTKVNGYERKDDKCKTSEVLQNIDKNEENEVNPEETNEDTINCNNFETVKDSEKLPLQDNEDTNSLKSLGKEEINQLVKYKPARRGGRTSRGRHRLSVEERLIEDNKEYYKVEVLGNKLRSSALPIGNAIVSPSKEQTDKSKKDDKPSSEKPVVVRFKRVRKSELSLLSDEAESFMFGDPRRDDDSDAHSDGEESSVLPKDTESDREDNNIISFVLTSSPPTNPTPKQEVRSEDESQDSSPSRARKRRRTQTEALIRDNTDYYKFETPGSRLRYQAPLTGISEPQSEKDITQQEPQEVGTVQVEEKVYPSKPSPEVEKMHFSFEAVPRSEPWYQTYQRQDEGSEYWHYFSDCDTQKPFLLPYEIENFHEILYKSIQSSVHRKRGRSRGGHVNMGSRSPRKSPRCHASTLAIMSTIIRRREQTTNLSTIEEEDSKKAAAKQAAAKQAASEPVVKSEKKTTSEKSDVDRDLKEIVKNLDEMLSSNDMPELDSFEVELLKNPSEDVVLEPESEPKGAPANLLELLDTCHDVYANGIDNSSCASSECGDLTAEFPLKRRKKRKNKTGWPGNKMRRKLHIKSLGEELQKHLDQERKAAEEANEKKTEVPEIEAEKSEDVSTLVPPEDEGIETEPETGKENEQVLNTIECKPTKGRRSKNKETKENCKESKTSKESKESKESNKDSTRESKEITKESNKDTSKEISKQVIKEISKESSKEISKESSKESKEVEQEDSETTESDEIQGKSVLKTVTYDEISPRKKRIESFDKCRTDEDEVTVTPDNIVIKNSRTLTSISEDSETSLSNNENLCTKDANSLLTHSEKSSPSKPTRKTQRNMTSSELSHQAEIENRRLSINSSPKKQSKDSSEDLPLDQVVIVPKKNRRRSKKLLQQRTCERSSSKVIFEVDNCKTETFLTIGEKQQQRRLKRTAKRNDDSVSSEQLPNGEIMDQALAERISPSVVTSSDVDQRRSSIDFQPVVRVMKIDDQVDMDNTSILSVAVASNRRLRSSSSPRSNIQPPAKRFRPGPGKRQLAGHWLKNS